MGSTSGQPAASADSAARLAVRPPAWLDRALEVLIVDAKAATIACAIDAVMHADSTRLRGKAIRTRAIGLTGGLFIVPVLWRLLPIAELGARVVVPIHWGTLYPPRFERWFGDRLTQPAVRFAEWIDRLAPGTDVRALEVGGATRIEL